MQFTLSSIISVFLLTIIVVDSTEVHTYNIPDVDIEVRADGLKVSIPDEEGIGFFEFHANVNKEIDEDIGDIFNRVSAPFNGHWMFFDKTIILKKGDVLHYWVSVYHNKAIQKKNLLSYEVTDIKP